MLRKRKFAKIWLYSQTVDQVVKQLQRNVKVLKEAKIQKLRIRFGALRIVNRIRK